MELYIHLPFCKSKCRYCDFNSCANVDESLVFSYLSALNREIRFAGEAYSKAKIDTVYIGGGTPSMLDAKRIASIMRVLSESFDLSCVRECSIECNPESLDEKKLLAYKEAGINRISIGVQSLSDANLRSVGRLHSAATALSAIALANKHFENVSCDVIVGLPYDICDNVADELKTLAPLVKHISVYALTLEAGTALAKRVEEEKVLLPSDDEVADMLTVAEDVLKANGFDKYEVSNFARKGYESKHNVGYWTGEEYLGLGAGAHSFIKTSDGISPINAPVRFAQPKDINAYIAGVNCAEAYDRIPRVETCVLSEKDVFNERIMLGLRMTCGVDGKLLEGRIPNELKSFFKFENGRVSLTRAGMAIMNSILVRIMQF